MINTMRIMRIMEIMKIMKQKKISLKLQKVNLRIILENMNMEQITKNMINTIKIIKATKVQIIPKKKIIMMSIIMIKTSKGKNLVQIIIKLEIILRIVRKISNKEEIINTKKII